MLVAFVPVLHKGYVELFQKYPDELGILGSDVLADFTALTRDCRTINPGIVKRAIEGLGIFSNIQVLAKADLVELAKQTKHIIMPDEDVSHALCEQYGLSNVTFESVFLRWNKMPTLQENIISPNRVILRDEFSRSMMNLAIQESEKSADWWRQVATAIVKDGSVIGLTHNTHLPTDFHLSVNGDPRTSFNAGERIDLSTSIHSEALVIARSAKAGISLAGSEAYVTTFPCPNCARLLAESGIKRVYYSKGYSLLDAEDIFKAYGIEVALVDLGPLS
ncbi:MAG: deaminase [Patescibacteria group bacterium]|jgi:dCMP deaminase